MQICSLLPPQTDSQFPREQIDCPSQFVLLVGLQLEARQAQCSLRVCRFFWPRRLNTPKFGLALIAVREDEDAASDLGVNPFATKLLGHALAAALTAAAGGVYAGHAAFIHPNGVFGFDISVAILLMPIIGG
jgi:ABC-type branched-subunit amino acid transport system permease subunit